MLWLRPSGDSVMVVGFTLNQPLHNEGLKFLGDAIKIISNSKSISEIIMLCPSKILVIGSVKGGYLKVIIPDNTVFRIETSDVRFEYKCLFWSNWSNGLAKRNLPDWRVVYSTRHHFQVKVENFLCSLAGYLHNNIVLGAW